MENGVSGFPVTANVASSSPILVVLMMEAIHSKLLFFQEPHGVISQKAAFFSFTLCFKSIV
jgi:hypothetical protein